ncbi:Aste57867_21344 [Aphanomyces stellatus]|uniref:Aste57867_21344 protein n=1 Tax=Aphanomyces stellatus TaxID=120398 RepID=A0A485LHY7_9STRA|nr:hypothetical protein As57867_021275 [Aphanomyces stellatus]VFT98016.1 Aste57867_21344 [Aphanomyces stellatus]
MIWSVVVRRPSSPNLFYSFVIGSPFPPPRRAFAHLRLAFFASHHSCFPLPSHSIMFTKIAVFAACALALVSGQNVNATQTSANTVVSAVDVTNNTLPAAVATEYGTEMLGAILAELKIEHIDSKPLNDEEYNETVDVVKGLLTGQLNITNKTEFLNSVREVLGRLSPEDYEQLTDDVVAELTIDFFNKTFGSATAKDLDIKVGANVEESKTGFESLSQEDFVVIGSAFGGCVLSVAVALAVVGARNKKTKAASTKSVLAEDVVDEIEAAEQLAAEDKDAEVEDVKTDSPAVVSV